MQAGVRTPVRVLDAGCGNGAMLAYFAEALPRLLPDVAWEFYGYDISDFGVRDFESYFGSAVERLRECAPGVPWRERLALIRAEDPWPWPDGFFSVVVSNQVGEHVADLEHWLAEQHRVLAVRGTAVHLFPVKSYVYEGHVFVPFVHRIASHDLAAAYLRTALRLGLSFRREGAALDWAAESHADYLRYNTFYRSGRELLAAAKRARLRGSFRFTGEFYGAKLRQLLRRRPVLSYKARRSALGDLLAYHACKYLASVTLVLERHNAYLAPDALDTGRAAERTADLPRHAPAADAERGRTPVGV
jgi:SAM-dependent methyltransferase